MLGHSYRVSLVSNPFTFFAYCLGFDFIRYFMMPFTPVGIHMNHIKLQTEAIFHEWKSYVKCFYVKMCVLNSIECNTCKRAVHLICAAMRCKLFLVSTMRMGIRWICQLFIFYLFICSKCNSTWMPLHDAIMIMDSYCWMNNAFLRQIMIK